MAQRRMIGRTVYRQTKFLRLSFAAQALYAHLMIDADDDGVVEAFPVIRLAGAAEEDLNELIKSGFLTKVNDELLVFINDWSKQNLLASDRYHKSVHTAEMIKQGFVRVDRGFLPPGSNMETECLQAGSNMETQSSLVEDSNSLVEDRIGKLNSKKGKEDEDRERGTGETPQTGQPPRVYGKFNNVALSGEQYMKASRVFDNVEKAINDLSEHKKNTGEYFDSDYDALMKMRRGELVVKK